MSGRTGPRSRGVGRKKSGWKVGGFWWFWSMVGLIFLILMARSSQGASSERIFHAGAHAIDITPREFPVIVNAMFTQRSAVRAEDPLHARCLVLDDGTNRIAIAVVDSCMLPRDLIDQAKELARGENWRIARRPCCRGRAAFRGNYVSGHERRSDVDGLWEAEKGDEP